MKKFFIVVIFLFSANLIFAESIDTLLPNLYTFEKTIYNNSNNDLKINSVTSNCLCTKAFAQDNKVSAFDSTKIIYEVEFSSLSGEKDILLLIDTGTVETNVMLIKETYFIKPDLYIKPKKLPAFTHVNVGETIDYKITINNKSNNNYKLLEPIIDNAKVEIIWEYRDGIDLLPNQENVLSIKLRLIGESPVYTNMTLKIDSDKIPDYKYFVMIN
jgi:hypothetical protein